MTKYDGDPIGIRAGRRGKFVLGKDRKKSMEMFLKTGKHPLIEHTREEHAKSVLPPMPTVDVNRPHIFLDLKQRSGVCGRIVVELFEDLYPSLCVPFRNRCLEVSAAGATVPSCTQTITVLVSVIFHCCCHAIEYPMTPLSWFVGISFHQEYTYRQSATQFCGFWGNVPEHPSRINFDSSKSQAAACRPWSTFCQR